MKLKFDCYCPTEWGQSVKVVGSIPELGNWDVEKAIGLTCCELNRWRIEIDCDTNQPICYKYILADSRLGGQTIEMRPSRTTASFLKNVETYCCIDTWQTLKTEYAAFLSSAFTNVLFKPDKRFLAKKNQIKTDKQIEISCIAPKLKSSQYVCISGDCDKLGNWIEHIPLSVGKNAKWSVRFNLDELPTEFEYKFIIKDLADTEFVKWSDGQNHRFLNRYDKTSISIKIDDGIIDVNPDLVRFAGVNVPVFSLRTEKSFGAGDFSDLRRLVGWASQVGLKMIQILPINDTISTYSFLDSYPYNAISVFALNPLYIDVFKLGALPDEKQQMEFELARKSLNVKHEVDYNQVVKLKLLYCKTFFENNFDKIVNSADFQHFVKKNADWLEPYAAFSLLRDINGTGDFHSWGKYAVYSQKNISKFFTSSHLHYHTAMFWCYIQFVLDGQLREATAYARSHGIILKGDIPIGISRCSVDAWSNPHLFHFDGQAGAPPDFFSTNGQNWGFPTYNWAQARGAGRRFCFWARARQKTGWGGRTRW